MHSAPNCGAARVAGRFGDWPLAGSYSFSLNIQLYFSANCHAVLATTNQLTSNLPCASRRLVTPHTRPSVTIRDQSELRESDVQEVQCTATATALYIQLCVYINIYTLLSQTSLVITAAVKCNAFQRL